MRFFFLKKHIRNTLLCFLNFHRISNQCTLNGSCCNGCSGTAFRMFFYNKFTIKHLLRRTTFATLLLTRVRFILLSERNLSESLFTKVQIRRNSHWRHQYEKRNKNRPKSICYRNTFHSAQRYNFFIALQFFRKNFLNIFAKRLATLLKQKTNGKI